MRARHLHRRASCWVHHAAPATHASCQAACAPSLSTPRPPACTSFAAGVTRKRLSSGICTRCLQQMQQADSCPVSAQLLGPRKVHTTIARTPNATSRGSLTRAACSTTFAAAHMQSRPRRWAACLHPQLFSACLPCSIFPLPCAQIHSKGAHNC